MISRNIALALLFTGAALAGCGRRGELDRPGPFLGAPSPPSAQQTRREESAAHAKAAAAAVADPQAPQSVEEVRSQPLPKPPEYPSPPPDQGPPASSTTPP